MSAFTFKHDAEFEGYRKMPREGMWNRHSGKLMIRCPDCHKVSSIDHYSISRGYLNPSVVCPHPPCTFHVQPVLLEGYVAASAQEQEGKA